MLLLTHPLLSIDALRKVGFGDYGGIKPYTLTARHGQA
jgi:hypothetical protein